MKTNAAHYLAIALSVTSLILLSACGASPTSAPAAPTSAAAATSAPAAMAAATAANRNVPAAATSVAQSSTSGVVPSNPAPVDRQIIKNAQLTMVVNSVDSAVVRLTGIASDVGGYLVGSRTFLEGSRKAAQVTLAVPVDNFESSLNLVRKVALTIENDLSSSNDVTEQFVDLQSRLTNLQATEARIRDFLGKAQTVDEALKINAQLSDVDQQIEAIKGKLNAMSARTTFSTITVDLHEPAPTPSPTATPTVTPTPTPVAWRPDQTFQSAVTVQTNVLRSLGDVFIWFAVVVLTYLVIPLLLFALVRWFMGKLAHPRPS